VEGLSIVGVMRKVRKVLGIQCDSGKNKFQNALAVKASLNDIHHFVQNSIRGKKNIFQKLREDVDTIISAMPTPVKKEHREYLQKQSRK
jgi:hypothetical protein